MTVEQPSRNFCPGEVTGQRSKEAWETEQPHQGRPGKASRGEGPRAAFPRCPWGGRRAEERGGKSRGGEGEQDGERGWDTPRSGAPSPASKEGARVTPSCRPSAPL